MRPLLPTVWIHAASGAGQAFEVRGWDIERFDPDHVLMMIRRAHEAGMNTISLSHEVVMNAEEILWDWHRYQHLCRFCDAAHERGMQVFFWNHQINNPPEDLIVPQANGPDRLRTDSRLWDWLERRYERVVERVPNFDGIILSLTESQFQVHRDNRVIGELSPAERMAKTIHSVFAALERHGKQLLVRDFLRSPQEMESFREALRHVPDAVGVFTKCVPNDWQYKYPPHPLLGAVAPHRQVMELDLHNETGRNRGVFMPALEYYRDQLRLARERGLAGAIGRCDDGFRSSMDTPAEASIFAYSRLLHDPDADVDALWREFFEGFVGPRAAPVVIEALKAAFEMNCAICYTLGFWTGTHTASIAYADGHLVNHSTALWSDDPRYAETERLLMESGPETVRAVTEEKQQAGRTARRCLARLAEVRDAMPPERYEQLRASFENAARHAWLAAHWARIYFALRWVRNTRAPQAWREVREALAAARVEIEEARRAGQEVHRMPVFLLEVEQTLADLEAA